MAEVESAVYVEAMSLRQVMCLWLEEMSVIQVVRC